MGVSAATIAATTLPIWAPKIAFAQGSSVKDTLILIYLRGGADGLSLCVPHGDSNYYSLRPTISVPQPSSGSLSKAIDLDGFWGLPQSLSGWKEIFDNDHLGIIPAVGRQNWSRSHFQAQTFMELDTDSVYNGGWLARHLASSPPTNANAALRAFTYSAITPLALAGAPQIIATELPESYGLTGKLQNEAEVLDTISRMYSRVRDETRALVRDARRTVAAFDAVGFDSYAPAGGVDYGSSKLGKGMKSVAAMIKADIGLEVAQLDKVGWDTHANQGTINGGMREMMDEVGAALTAFYRDMMASGKTNWTAIVVSEFGRQVKENGSAGTDHGTGGVMFTMGPNVTGGFHGTWPGLAPENLFEGVDVMPTVDDRDVLADLLQCRLHNGNMDFVFPSRGVPTQPQGFFKAA